MDARIVGSAASVLLHVVAAWGLAPLSPARETAVEPLRVSLLPLRERERPRPAPMAAASTPGASTPSASAPGPQSPQSPSERVSPVPPAPLLSAAAGSPPIAAGTPAFAASPAPVAVAALPVARPAPLVPPVFDAAYLRNPAPAYPLMSRKRGEHGRVLLRVRVNPEGAAEEVLLRDSSGFARLDDAAVAAVRQWRFVPAREADRAVAAWVLVPVQFAMEN